MKIEELSTKEKLLDTLNYAVGMVDDTLLELEEQDIDSTLLNKAEKLRELAFEVLVGLERQDPRYCIPTRELRRRGAVFYTPPKYRGKEVESSRHRV